MCSAVGHAEVRKDLVLDTTEYEKGASRDHEEAERGVDEPIDTRNVCDLPSDPCADHLAEP